MVDLAKLQCVGRPPAWQARNDVGDDMTAQRRVETVIVVADRVLGIKLVAVLAIDKPAGLRLERCSVGKGKLVNQTCTLELGLDFAIPPRLCVVVSRQIDDGPLFSRGEAAKGREERLVLRSCHSHRRTILAVRNPGDTEEIKEIAGQDKFDRTGMTPEVVEQLCQVVR